MRTAEEGGFGGPTVTNSTTAPAANNRPILPAGIRELFVAIDERVPDGYQLEYRPGLLGKGKVHFVDKRGGIDVWRNCFVLQTIHDTPPDDVWDGAYVYPQDLITDGQPDVLGRFAELPSELARDKSYSIFARHLRDHLYRDESLKVWKCEAVGETSRPDEDEAAFRARLAPILEERLKAERAKIEKSYAAKLTDADDRIQRAKARVSTQRWQFFARIGTMLWVIADTVLSMMGKGLPGRRRSLDPAFRSAATERGQQSSAQVALDKALHDKEQMEQELREKLKNLSTQLAADTIPVEPIELKPQKGDITVDSVSLVWLPWRIDRSGQAEPVY